MCFNIGKDEDGGLNLPGNPPKLPASAEKRSEETAYGKNAPKHSTDISMGG